MHRSLLSAVLSLSVLLSSLVAAQDVSYTFTTFDFPSGIYTTAVGINTRGQIVGHHGEDIIRSFLKVGATFTTIDVPGAIDGTFAAGINNRGQIVGWFQDHQESGLHSFLATPIK